MPSVSVGVSILLALGLVQVDHVLGSRYGGRLTFGAGPDGAREVLSAITSSMITFTGLVFSITIVVLQLTSSQFSPRVLRTFLRDRQTQLSLGIFVGTFVYALLVLRTVRGGNPTADVFVPGVSTTVAVLLLLLSVGVFVAYIHHIATAIQVSSIIRAIASETKRALERRFPVSGQQLAAGNPHLATGPSTLVTSGSTGVVVAVDVRVLVNLACESRVRLVLRGRLGDFVPEHAPLVEVHRDPGRLDVRGGPAGGGAWSRADDEP